jgi:hypothetical protein
MADSVLTGCTSLSGEDVVVRAVQFFSSGNWTPTTQSSRAVTFQGKPPIPWGLMILTYLGFLACVVPGIILYIKVIKKLNQFQNLVLTTSAEGGSTGIVIQCPPRAAKLAEQFLETLPKEAV